MERYFKKISETNTYKTITKYIDKSYCCDSELIGSVSYLCREHSKTFYDWFLYYFKTEYFPRLSNAAFILQQELSFQNLNYDTNTCYKILSCFVLYATFKGCEIEIKAKELFKDYGVRFATKEEDVKYAVDLIFDKFAVQIKPLSYKFLSKEKKKINDEKNLEYKKDFKKDVIYLYYDKETGEFENESLKNVKTRLGWK